MKMQHIRSVVMALAAASAATSAASAELISTYDFSAEGWTGFDFVGAGNYTTPLAGEFPLAWNGDGGNPGGHVSAADFSDGAIFFRAPAAYRGDRSGAIGEFLSFDVFTTHDTYGGDNAVILVGNSGDILVAQIVQPLVNVWQTITIDLDADRFRVGSLGGAVPSVERFASVLADLEELYLPGEFASGLIETTRIDNVRLVPTPAAGALLLAAGLRGMRRRRTA